MRYRVINTASGKDLGCYEADDEEGAIRAMLSEAHCTDEPDPDLRAVPDDSPSRGGGGYYATDGNGEGTYPLARSTKEAAYFFGVDCQGGTEWESHDCDTADYVVAVFRLGPDGKQGGEAEETHTVRCFRNGEVKVID